MKTVQPKDLIKRTDNLFEVPTSFDPTMKVPAHIFLNDALVEDLWSDMSVQQLVHMTTMPGIVKAALAMPDVHQGYGFPIGGVAAFDIKNGGIISPGGIGYDINCGVRLLASNISGADIAPYLEELATALFRAVPSGVGKGGLLKASPAELDAVLTQGAARMVAQGYGTEADLACCEENGCMTEADASSVSEKAKKRGADQLGTLGSGNHFLEVQEVTQIYDEETARIFGLHMNMIVVMIHCGSRGLGHQTCTDYVQRMVPQQITWGFELPDKGLTCAPCSSQEGQDYYAAMCAAANFAWANRHLIGHQVRTTFEKVIGQTVTLDTVYDLSHNMGKKEIHSVDGSEKELMVHRKGATRSFPGSRRETPHAYKQTGHPVLIPGTMGTSSYVLVGTEAGMERSFGSCCHGAGRRLSRTQAKKTINVRTLKDELAAKNIIVRCDSDRGLTEEAPGAYKDVEEVVSIVKNAELARPVARLEPRAVIKGG